MTARKILCEECGSEIEPDDSPGVWVHTTTDGMGDGHDLDADHVARPPEGTAHPEAARRYGARREVQRRYEIEIQATLRNVRDLETLIADYEATGGHDHGRGPIVGRKCPGGDCLVHEARTLLAKIAGKP